MTTRIELTLKDTMAFWNDDFGAFLFDPNGPSLTNIFLYEVPDTWVAGGTLTPDGFEQIFRHLYGASWKSGNGDGSKHEVLESKAKVIGSEDPRVFKLVT